MADETEESPLLLTEGGPKGAGCGGDQVGSIGLPGNMLRPTSVSPDGLPPCSSGMTATGSHVHFYSLRGAQPQGEGFGLCKPLAPTAPHPAGIMIPATFPQGKASLKRVGTLLQPPTVHPLRHLRCHLPLHAGRLTPCRFCVWNPSGRGMPPPLHPFFSLLSSLFSY